MPLISVLMSVHNEKREELDASLYSILNQTHTDFELIIINDNPNNKKLCNIVAEYPKLDERIKLVVNDENIGLAESINKAASLAEGQYFLRMDADDICDPTRFEKQIKVISEEDYDLVCSSYYFIDERGAILDKSVEWLDSYSLAKLLIYRNVIHHPTVIMKADLFRKVNGYRNFKCSQDYDLWLRMLESNCKFYMMKEKLIYYRIRSESTTVKNRYIQASTLEYIKSIHANNRKGGQDGYSYKGYLEYLSSKNVDNTDVSNDYLSNFVMYIQAKNDIKQLHFIKGLYGVLKVLFKSKYYRPNVRKAFAYHMLKKILRLRYNLIIVRKMYND